MTRGGKVFAVYDMSSSSVAGAHVLATHAKEPIAVLAQARSDAALQEDMDMQRFVEETLKHLDGVIARVKKADMHHPSYIQVVLASPWYTSQTRTIVYKKDTPFVCTKKMVDMLIADDMVHMLKEEQGAFGSFGNESVVVEKQLSKIMLNGYHTDHPFGKKAKVLEIFLTVTIAPKPILDRFTDVLKRAYGVRTIAFTTSPFTTFIMMRDLNPATEDCVVIDVGEEVSDVAFVKKGVVLYQHSFPVGTFGLYRALSGKTSNTARESMTLLESYRLGKLTPAASKSIETAIASFRTHWQSWFHQVLDNGQYGFCIPEHCVIVADPRFEALFTELLSTDAFLKHNCSHATVTVTFVSEAFLSHKVRTVDHVPTDIPLATGALFAQRLL